MGHKQRIASARRPAANYVTVDEVCRMPGVSEPTFCRGRRPFVVKAFSTAGPRETET